MPINKKTEAMKQNFTVVEDGLLHNPQLVIMVVAAVANLTIIALGLA